jgi:AraC-like DNA-binding protein
VVRTAERDVRDAAVLARAGRAALATPPRDDLPDQLAAALAAGAVGSLRAWAERHGVARETASRAFTAAYGVDARRFRAELRARAAWLAITTTSASLAEIAYATAYADQAHMSRGVRAHTGRSPAAWRASSR